MFTRNDVELLRHYAKRECHFGLEFLADRVEEQITLDCDPERDTEGATLWLVAGVLEHRGECAPQHLKRIRAVAERLKPTVNLAPRNGGIPELIYRPTQEE